MASGFTGRARGFYGRVEPGSRIAGYVIEERIGSGGMAVVFRARDEALGRLAAVKIIAPTAADDEEFRARFLRESRMAAAVDSLHIIPVYGAGEADGLLYIATRFVQGGDLEALRRRSGGVVAPVRVGKLVAQVASALDAAHDAGLVHRDVKLQNVLVDTLSERAEHAFLTDFGLSKGTSSTGLTATGQFVGTPDYCAPEQIRSMGTDGRADQYALGCVAFVLLTGELPFRRGDAMATLYAQVHDPVPALTALRPDLPRAAHDVVARALAKTPADRYARCGEFAEALERALFPSRSATSPAHLAPPLTDWARSAQAPQAWDSDSVLHAVMEDLAAADQWSDGHTSTVGGGNASSASTRGPLIGGRRRHPRRRRGGRAAVIGGTAAVILAAAGIAAAVSLPGSSHATASGGSPPAPGRPAKPVLAATLTVPGGGHVSQAWFSQDGKLIAGVGNLEPAIYVWKTSDPGRVITLAVPKIKIGNSSFLGAVHNIAFNADDTSLTMSITAANGDGSALKGITPNIVDEWNLATRKLTVEGEISSVSEGAGGVLAGVLFSGDNSRAVRFGPNDGVIQPETLGPTAEVDPAATLPGAQPDLVSASMNDDGTELLYAGGNNLNYVWNLTQGKAIAELPYKGLRPLLSPDGESVMEYPALPAGASSPVRNSPVIWDVATRSDITPTDPRWTAQESLFTAPAEFSTDGSVIETMRAGGKVDLWDVATHKYLMTITEANFKVTSAVVGPGGSEVAVLGGGDGRQVALWETPLSPPKSTQANAKA